jgi:hypothetical protein
MSSRRATTFRPLRCEGITPERPVGERILGPSLRLKLCQWHKCVGRRGYWADLVSTQTGRSSVNAMGIGTRGESDLSLGYLPVALLELIQALT